MVVAQARHQKKPVKRPAKAAGSNAPSVWQRHARDLWIVLLIVVGLFVTLAEAGALGPVGRAISTALAVAFGVGRFALPVMLLGLGAALVVGKIEVDRPRLGWGIALGLVSLCGIGHLFGGRPSLHAKTKALAHAGGWLGAVVGGGLDKTIGVAGALVVLLALLVVAIMVGTGIGLGALYAGTVALVRAVGSRFARWWSMRPQRDAGYLADEDEDEVAVQPAKRARSEPVEEFIPEPDEYEDEYEEESEYEPSGEPGPVLAPVVPLTHREPIMTSEWRLPSPSLLLRTKEQKQDRGAIEVSTRRSSATPSARRSRASSSSSDRV
jgi:hypothetical protein